ncbi:Hypothetical protein A7982_07372 [Minicystis rosea]|nr:Hypothetical protein A7982_07372 [Minicystis rosea]
MERAAGLVGSDLKVCHSILLRQARTSDAAGAGHTRVAGAGVATAAESDPPRALRSRR